MSGPDAFEELLTSRFTALLGSVKKQLEIELHALHVAYRGRAEPAAEKPHPVRFGGGESPRALSRNPSPTPTQFAQFMRGLSNNSIVRDPPKVSVESQLNRGLLRCGGQITTSLAHDIEEAVIHQIRDQHFHHFPPSAVHVHEPPSHLGIFGGFLQPESASRRGTRLEIPRNSHSNRSSGTHPQGVSPRHSARNSPRGSKIAVKDTYTPAVDNEGHLTVSAKHLVAVEKLRQKNQTPSPPPSLNRLFDSRAADDSLVDAINTGQEHGAKSLATSQELKVDQKKTTPRSSSTLSPKSKSEANQSFMVPPQKNEPLPPFSSPPAILSMETPRASMQSELPVAKVVTISQSVPSDDTRPHDEGGRQNLKHQNTKSTDGTSSHMSALSEYYDSEENAVFPEMQCFDSDQDDFHFTLSPAWNAPERPTVRLSCDADLAGAYGSSSTELDSRHRDFVPTCLDKLVVIPTCSRRIVWDLLGVLFVAYDCIVLPLQFFDVDDTGFLKFMTWCVRLYWTLDFPFTFFTGYEAPGAVYQIGSDSLLNVVELRFRKIATRYIKTWMTFDVLIIACDWLELAFDGLGDLSAARAGKLAKAVRLLRMIRLMRILRANRNSTLPDYLKQITYKVGSEKTRIIFSMMWIIMAMILLTHFMACLWYAAGSSWSDQYANTWTKEFKVDTERDGFEYSYATSFHWSLSQFAGNVEITPVNTLERFFAVCALLCGFVVAAFVVSSITSSMTQLQIVMARQSTQVSMLNRYLSDHNISSKLALRVQKNAQYASLQNERNTPENSIELLALVSEPLRVELHFEIHGPCLMWHPFFNFYADMNPAAMRRICHTAVSCLTLFPGDVLFSTGEMPHFPRMYFCSTGKLEYNHESKHRHENLRERGWACEASLWTTWPHHGTLRASVKSHTEIGLATLNAQVFQNIAVNFATVENWPKRYGTWFVEHLNSLSAGSLSDLKDPDVDYEFVVDEIAEGRLGQLPNTGGRKSFTVGRSRSQDPSKDPTSSLFLQPRLSVNSQRDPRRSAKRTTFKGTIEGVIAKFTRSFSDLRTSMRSSKTSRGSGRGGSGRAASTRSENRASSNPQDALTHTTSQSTSRSTRSDNGTFDDRIFDIQSSQNRVSSYGITSVESLIDSSCPKDFGFESCEVPKASFTGVTPLPGVTDC